jgi:hypothetical protein
MSKRTNQKTLTGDDVNLLDKRLVSPIDRLLILRWGVK